MGSRHGPCFGLRIVIRVGSLLVRRWVGLPSSKRQRGSPMRKLALCFLFSCVSLFGQSKNARPPQHENDLRQWLENMVWFHHFSTAEIRQATGLSEEEIGRALAKFNIPPDTKPAPPRGAVLTVLPYPGG